MATLSEPLTVEEAGTGLSGLSLDLASPRTIDREASKPSTTGLLSSALASIQAQIPHNEITLRFMFRRKDGESEVRSPLCVPEPDILGDRAQRSEGVTFARAASPCHVIPVRGAVHAPHIVTLVLDTGPEGRYHPRPIR